MAISPDKSDIVCSQVDKYILKVKVNQNIHPNILSEIIIIQENGCCGGDLA